MIGYKAVLDVVALIHNSHSQADNSSIISLPSDNFCDKAVSYALCRYVQSSRSVDFALEQ